MLAAAGSMPTSIPGSLAESREETDMQPTTSSSGSAFQLEVLAGDLAQVTFDVPGSRVNTLSLAVLSELEQVLARLAGQPHLQGLIFRSGKPGMFLAGADLRELAAAPADPEQARMLVRRGLELIARLEALPYPTVVLIDGTCLGGGLELALGFDYRLAGTHPKTELGLPEVKIGLIPGWGGTQRLSRLIGPSLAAELICSGEPVRASRALQLGLVFDVVASEHLLAEARRLLAWSRQSGDWRQVRRRKQQPVGLSEEQRSFAAAVARQEVLGKTRGLVPAPLAALEAIFQGCNLPLEEGLKVETEHFVPLVGSLISRNLMGVFFLTQRAQKGPAGLTAAPRPVQRVGIVGAGLMGSGIAGVCLRRGLAVVLTDVAPAALEKGVAAIAQGLHSQVERGRLRTEEAVAALARLSATLNPAVLADCDVVIEAIVEDETAKTRLYQELQPRLKAEAILASNTSTLSISRLAQAVPYPERFAGMHFFNPAERMPLVEVIRGVRSSEETLATLAALAQQLGKTPLVVRDGPGFLVNRILFPYLNEALALLEEGASPRALDQAALDFGMPMGPITLHDVVGLDTALFAGRVLQAAFPERSRPTRILAELVAAGRLGQKSGAGFYRYPKGLRGLEDPALESFLERCRREHRTFTSQELTDRLFLPMLAEAVRVLEEQLVSQPAEVDLGLLLGIGFPAWRGGLLRWADSVGLKTIVEKMQHYESVGKQFQAPARLRQLAEQGQHFYPHWPPL
jgi:3-hydroxyacyl-CoA dehydrogenase/enoyl-CoA hydratase/3-hydroxybutyryl-CoA epimerase/enoyl-CoA isomerase